MGSAQSARRIQPGGPRSAGAGAVGSPPPPPLRPSPSPGRGGPRGGGRAGDRRPAGVRPPSGAFPPRRCAATGSGTAGKGCRRAGGPAPRERPPGVRAAGPRSSPNPGAEGEDRRRALPRRGRPPGRPPPRRTGARAGRAARARVRAAAAAAAALSFPPGGGGVVVVGALGAAPRVWRAPPARGAGEARGRAPGDNRPPSFGPRPPVPRPLSPSPRSRAGKAGRQEGGKGGRPFGGRARRPPAPLFPTGADCAQCAPSARRRRAGLGPRSGARGPRRRRLPTRPVLKHRPRSLARARVGGSCESPRRNEGEGRRAPAEVGSRGGRPEGPGRTTGPSRPPRRGGGA